MDRLFEFIANHPILCAIFVGLWGALIWIWARTARGIRSVDASEAVQMLSHNNALTVDIRGENEFHDGHVINSIHIPSNYLKDRLNKLEKYRNRPIIVICATGQDSSRAGAKLQQQGFKEVLCLNGGIAAWRSANLPLTTK